MTTKSKPPDVTAEVAYAAWLALLEADTGRTEQQYNGVHGWKICGVTIKMLLRDMYRIPHPDDLAKLNTKIVNYLHGHGQVHSIQQARRTPDTAVWWAAAEWSPGHAWQPPTTRYADVGTDTDDAIDTGDTCDVGSDADAEVAQEINVDDIDDAEVAQEISGDTGAIIEGPDMLHQRADSAEALITSTFESYRAQLKTLVEERDKYRDALAAAFNTATLQINALMAERMVIAVTLGLPDSATWAPVPEHQE